MHGPGGRKALILTVRDSAGQVVAIIGQDGGMWVRAGEDGPQVALTEGQVGKLAAMVRRERVGRLRTAVRSGNPA